MSFEQFPDNLHIRILETDESASMGLYSIPSNVQLTNLVVTLHKLGAEAGSERFRVNIHSEDDPNFVTPIYSSAWFDWTSAGSFTNFLGTVRFDLTGAVVRTGSYFLVLEADNYTRNADTFYFAYVLDDPAVINSRTNPKETGAQIAFLGAAL